MHTNIFSTDYSDIINKLNEIDPVAYSRSRNYIDGAITYLSPYISRGVISTKQVMEAVLNNGFSFEQSEKLIQELAWREYFQRVWQHLEDDMFDDIRLRYTGIQTKKIPTSLIEANTGVEAIDKAINNLYETGYMHNHLRMYTASVACNIGKAHWQQPSQWMYYHLLDGDLASNTCSWQWVAGTFSSKQYYCNQDNINKYTGTEQQNTFLSKSYEELPQMDVPTILQNTTVLSLETKLPAKQEMEINLDLPVLLYNSYNLDPMWKADIEANRILVLEPSHFKKYPVSEKVLDFILALAKNIDGLQVFVGEVNEMTALQFAPAIYSKEHPAFKHFPGIKEQRDWMFPEVKGHFNSFFSFWKKCEKHIKKNEIVRLPVAC